MSTPHMAAQLARHEMLREAGLAPVDPAMLAVMRETWQLELSGLDRRAAFGMAVEGVNTPLIVEGRVRAARAGRSSRL